MSDLRKQLQAGREQYRSQRYPGDLAGELLAGPQRRSIVFKMFIGAVGVSGIAAAIALFVMMSGPATTPTRTQPGGPVAVNVKPPVVVTSTTTQPAADSVAPVTELASMPQFPQDVPMAPTTESSDTPMVPAMDSMELGSMPSMPSMPSFDMSFSDTDTQQQTSKEST